MPKILNDQAWILVSESFRAGPLDESNFHLYYYRSSKVQFFHHLQILDKPRSEVLKKGLPIAGYLSERLSVPPLCEVTIGYFSTWLNATDFPSTEPALGIECHRQTSSMGSSILYMDVKHPGTTAHSHWADP